MRTRLCGMVLCGLAGVWCSVGRGGEGAGLVRVAGRAFLDANGNGVLDASEKGLPGVGVSNGLTIRQTGADGAYELLVDTDRMPFVFVIKPTGHRLTNAFYKRCVDRQTRQRADFGLTPFAVPEARQKGLTFFHISDIHCPMSSRADMKKVLRPLVDELVNDLAEAGGQFIVNTGDTANQGTARQFADFADVVLPGFACPTYHVVGNHDLDVKSDAPRYTDLRPYYRTLGPNYYSFNYLDSHFIVLDVMRAKDDVYKAQLAWLAKDLALFSGTHHIIVLSHNISLGWQPDLKRVFTPYRVLAELAGHQHFARVWEQDRGERGPIACIQASVFNPGTGGIDGVDSGYLAVTVKDGRINTRMCFLGKATRIDVIGERRNGQVWIDGPVLRVRCCDDRSAVIRCEHRYGGGDWTALESMGGALWQTHVDTGGAIEIRQTSRKGRTTTSRIDLRIRAHGPSDRIRTGADWPMFQHDPLHTGRSEDAVRAPLRLRWTRACAEHFHLASPIIADGKVIVGLPNEGIDKGGVLALDAGTGREVWRHRTRAAVRHTPCFANGRVVFSTSSGETCCLNARTGKKVWGRQGSLAVQMSHAVVGDVLYAGTDGRLRTYRLDTGQPIAASVTTGWPYASYVSPAVGHGRAYYADCASLGLFCFDRNLKTVWQWVTKLGKQRPCSHASVVIHQDKVFWPVNSHVFALRPDTGEVIWKRSLGPERIVYPTPVSTPCVSGDRLFVGSEATGTLTALDTATGRVVWEYRTGRSLIPYGNRANCYAPAIFGSPVVSGDVVYVGGADGCLHGVDARTGRPVCCYRIGTPITSSPAVSGNTVVVTGRDGWVYAFTGQSTRTGPPAMQR